MVSLRKRNTKSLMVHVLKKMPAMLGCLLFLFSAILPFYHFTIIKHDSWFAPNYSIAHSIYYWSFKSDIHIYGLNHFGDNQTWFSDYWFKDPLGTYLGLSWLLISMFTIQILTLAMSIASIVFNNRLLSLTPVLLCLSVTIMMIYVNDRLYFEFSTFDAYQQGYWYTYPSMLLFTVAFILSLVFHKSRTMNLRPASADNSTHLRASC